MEESSSLSSGGGGREEMLISVKLCMARGPKVSGAMPMRVSLLVGEKCRVAAAVRSLVAAFGTVGVGNWTKALLRSTC